MDNDLATGVEVTPTNEIFGNEQSQTNVQAVEAQKQAIAELMPSIDSLKAIFQEERDSVTDIRSYMSKLGDKPSGEDIQAEYRARELYIGFIDRLEGGIASRLGEHYRGQN